MSRDKRIGVPSRIATLVRELDDDVYYLREEVADALGVAPTTLKDWGTKIPELGPTAYVYFGGTRVFLYTDEDVERLRQHAERKWPVREGGQVRKRGRPQLWTPEQRRERNCRQRKAIHLRRKADRLEYRGHLQQARQLRAQAEQIKGQLAMEYDARWLEVTGRPAPLRTGVSGNRPTFT